MKQFLIHTSTIIFAIFIGSQITEGVLLVPYWQSLPAPDFYAYYSEFGTVIGRFYTILTILAAAIPICVAIYCRLTKTDAFKFAAIASLFAILFIAFFYVYFKDTNELFFQAALSETALQEELVTWSYWHWGRIVVEVISLSFLIVAFDRMRA
ncbi:MAG: hypothetical protein AAF847_06310 [Bacteroidota bacterium]